MAQQVRRLNARSVITITKAGRHADGDGLYLNVTESGARSWVFMWKVAGRRREIGLGSFRDVPLAKARELAAEARQNLLEGRDPLTTREKRKAMTFGEAADALIESMAPSWRNEKHKAQWGMTLRVYCEPIRNKPVSDVTTDDVLWVLKPIWRSKAETASRLRGRIERVLDYAKTHGMRSGENPARWRGHLDAALPRRQKLTRGHHKAMPYEAVPAFLSALRNMEGVSPRALEFTILTAARTGEVIGARWEEVDLEARLWVLPASRTKAGREHRVPLSARASATIAALEEVRVSGYVFPSVRRDKPLSNMAMEAVLRRMKQDVTVHGFRSAFRDWVGEETDFPREVAEAALGHIVGDAVERAYRRGTRWRKGADSWKLGLSFALRKQNSTLSRLPRLPQLAGANRHHGTRRQAEGSRA